jgi:hypothetical protein
VTEAIATVSPAGNGVSSFFDQERELTPISRTPISRDQERELTPISRTPISRDQEEVPTPVSLF